jgi:hypothetical protein
VRELYVVAVSDDGKHLLVSTSKTLRGAFLLPLDARLRKAVAGELQPPKRAEPVEPAEPPETAEPPAESALSPREIQARLRAGHTPQRVARAAGVPVERVTRFYGPVLSERARVVDEVRSATLTRARRGASAAPLGDAVAANLTARNVPVPTPEQWTAFRRADGTWVVRLEVESRGRKRRAEWRWDPAARTVSAADTYAADLAHVDAPLPRRRAATRAGSASRARAR